MKIHPYYFSQQKRIFDFILSLLLLIFFSPLLLLIGILIFITAGNPIIFSQQRTGFNGKTFKLFKFRTMAKNAAMIKHKYQHLNQAPLPMFKIHDDPRFVGLGKWLARTGLDELPQLLNILRGEMSFVGPRPLPITEAKDLPNNWKSWRKQVRPGIFSDWGLSKERHESLKNWQALEKTTLKFGSLKKDLWYIVITPFSQIWLTIHPGREEL